MVETFTFYTYNDNKYCFYTPLVYYKSLFDDEKKLSPDTGSYGALTFVYRLNAYAVHVFILSTSTGIIT